MTSSTVFNALNDITDQCLTCNSSAEEFLFQSTSILTNKLSLEDFVIYLKQNSNRKFKQVVKANKVRGPFIPHHTYTIDLGEGIVGSSARSKKAIMVEDTSKNEIYISEDVFRYSELAVPIMYRNAVIGILDSEHPDKNFYSKEILDVFGLMAKLISYFFNESKFRSREEVEKKHFDFFIEQLNENKIYLNEFLSSKDVAEMLSISPAYFSQIVNKVGGQSFNTIVNTYRVQHTIDLLYRLEHKKRSLFSIALSAGFNSKSSFNLNFRKVTSKSPTEFIASLSQ